MTGFQAIRLVTAREVRERGRSRAYLLSSVFSLLIILALVFIPAIFSGRTTMHHVGLVGTENEPIVAATRALLAAGDEGTSTRIETTAFTDLATAKTALDDGEVAAVLVDGTDMIVPATSGIFGRSSLESLLQQAAATVQVQKLVAVTGNASDVVKLLAGSPLTVTPLGGADPEQAKTRGIVAYAGLMIMYIAILTYGAWTLTGVTEEKSSRVVEVLLATLRPWQLLAGKILGMGILGLAQLLVTLAAALAAVQVTGVLHLPGPPIDSALTLVLWFVLGFALYSVAYATAGSLVSRAEEAQSVTAPLSIVAVAGFLASFMVLDRPDSTLAVVLTFVPLTAPFVTPIRVALRTIPAWESALAAVVAAGFVVALLRLAGRVYAGGILQFGGRLKLRQAYRSSGL